MSAAKTLPEHDTTARDLVETVRELVASDADPSARRARWISESQDFVDNGVARGFQAALVQSVETALRHVLVDARADHAEAA